MDVPFKFLDLVEPVPWSGKCIPEALELELIGLLAHLILSTLSSTAAAEEETICTQRRHTNNALQLARQRLAS